MNMLKKILNFFNREGNELEVNESTSETKFVSSLIMNADKEVKVYRITQKELPVLNNYAFEQSNDLVDNQKVINRLKVLSGFTPEKTIKEINGTIAVKFAGREPTHFKTTFKTDQSAEIIKEKG
jgi:hypothetical protein